MLPLDAFISNVDGKPFILSSIATLNIACGEILKKFAFEKDFFALKMCFFCRYRMVYPSNWILDTIEKFALSLKNQSPNQYKKTQILKCFYKYFLGFPFFINDFETLSAIGAFMDETKIDSNVIFNNQNDYYLFMEQVKLFQDEFQYFHRLID